MLFMSVLTVIFMLPVQLFPCECMNKICDWIPQSENRFHQKKATENPLIFGAQGPYFVHDQVKATYNEHLCEVNTEEYKSFLKAVKRSIQKRLKEIPLISKVNLERFEKQYTHELGTLEIAVNDSTKKEFIPSLYNAVIQGIGFEKQEIAQRLVDKAKATQKLQLYEQQFSQWSDQIDAYNARAALKARIKRINNTLNYDKNNAALLLGKHYHDNGQPHHYVGFPVQLPDDVIHRIGSYMEPDTMQVSEKEIVRHAKWGSRFEGEDRLPYQGMCGHENPNDDRVKTITVKGENSMPVELAPWSELGFILGTHDHYKDQYSKGYIHFKPGKYWKDNHYMNDKYRLRDKYTSTYPGVHATYTRWRPKYGPTLYHFDDRAFKEDKKLREKKAL